MANPVRVAIVVFKRSVNFVFRNDFNTSSKLRKVDGWSVCLLGLGVLRQSVLVYESNLTSSIEHVWRMCWFVERSLFELIHMM